MMAIGCIEQKSLFLLFWTLWVFLGKHWRSVDDPPYITIAIIFTTKFSAFPRVLPVLSGTVLFRAPVSWILKQLVGRGAGYMQLGRGSQRGSLTWGSWDFALRSTFLLCSRLTALCRVSSPGSLHPETVLTFCSS